MKNISHFLFVVILLLLLSCDKEVLEENTNDPALLEYINSEIEADIFFNGEYIELKSIEVFDSILNYVNSLEYNEFAKWEFDLGFKSANTLKVEFEKLLYSTKDDDQYNSVLNEYSDLFTKAENEPIKYKFYASSLARLLSIEGYIKIGKSLYCFSGGP